MRIRRGASVLAFVMLAVPLWADGKNRFESPTAGIAFSKPESWIFASMQAALDNREKVRLDDAELERQMKAQANPPLAVVMKHPEPYPDVNPSFQVGLRPLGPLEGKTATEILGLIVPTLEKAHADFRIVTPISESMVGGLAAARVSIHYTLKTSDGGAYPTWSDMVVVPRGKFMFFIGMGRKQGDEGATAEVEKMLASIEFQP